MHKNLYKDQMISLRNNNWEVTEELKKTVEFDRDKDHPRYSRRGRRTSRYSLLPISYLLKYEAGVQQ